MRTPLLPARLAASIGLHFVLWLAFAVATRAVEPLTTIPINTSRDHVMVPVSLNGSNGFSFMLDTGFSYTMIHPDLTTLPGFRRAGEITVIGIAGEERAPTYEGAILNLSG